MVRPQGEKVHQQSAGFRRLVKSALPASIVVLLLWTIAWVASVAGPLRTISQQAVGDTFNSLNALFAGLAFVGVLTTIVFQLFDQAEAAAKLKEASDANKLASDASRMAVESARKTMDAATDKAVLDMFQTFCSPYFQEVKSASHAVLINCMVSRRYRDFVVSRLFVVDQLEMDEELKAWLVGKRQADESADVDGNLSKERMQRYKLDELMNFFSLLSVQHCNDEIVTRCDFAYPWWRPLFWEIALTQRERYDASANIKTYCKPEPRFLETVVALDKLYGYEPFADRAQLEEHLAAHPKIQAYRQGPRAQGAPQ